MARHEDYDSRAVSRFWDRVEPELNTGCWLWSGAAGSWGYGNVWIAGSHDQAHRLSWKLTRGAIPHGHHVCHKCDTPACVNPDHLFLGTNAENREDMRRKGRGRGSYLKGERNGMAKLTADDVVLIRARAAAGEQYTRIAADYGLTRTAITAVATGKSWSHILGARAGQAAGAAA